ncbi:MAG: sulfatase-like hydrolase/transferase, partial [Verrucomicrobiota bacterium]
MNAPTLMALMVCLLTLIRHTITAEPFGSSPNIIYILADDLGYGDLGCYGQQTLRTPRIDAMAKEGMRFTQHYAGSTICAPSRCVLL